MRILCIHNRYQIRGGEEECYEAEVNLLRSRGHIVDTYEENNDSITTLGSFRTAIRTIWSGKSYQAIKLQLIDQTYDIVHVQNFFPLISPSIYYAAKDQGVPVIQTLHNYRLICPNAKFFRDNRVCEDCLSQSIPLSGLIHGCYRESRAASASVVAMIAIHRALQTWIKMVDRYIVLTEFAREKFIQGGIPAEKLVVKPNFVPDPGIGQGRGGYALYAGRLSSEKGIGLILSAWEQLGNKIPLIIIGDGPLADQVAKVQKTVPGIEWLGRKPLEDVYALLKEASFLVFPSQWHEGLPRIIIESFAVGTPVVAANLGSMSNLIQPGHTGLHFQAGNTEDLIAKIEWLLSEPLQLSQMRQKARAEYESKYTAEQNYSQLLEIYTENL
jgi:glycosyltransferase involved in cell wall biosynthesis